MTEQELVRECITAICHKNGFSKPSEMTYRDFEHISQELEEKTGTLISVSTIKRLLNGDFSRIPQTATLNAISNYLGFKNWQEYKITTGTVESKPASQPVAETKNSFIPSITPGKLIYNKWTSYMLALAVLLMIFSFIRSKTSSGVSYKTASFSFIKTTANDLPNTVIFEYDVSGVNADSFLYNNHGTAPVV
ncbi:MAG: helix-turn-helix domain-containing protein [Sphingobacteriales bacterium]|nr:helix-turn-helix domain-containing protein [Sphingobacteriales bacterium]